MKKDTKNYFSTGRRNMKIVDSKESLEDLEFEQEQNENENTQEIKKK